MGLARNRTFRTAYTEGPTWPLSRGLVQHFHETTPISHARHPGLAGLGLLAERHHQHVAMGGLRRVQRLHRRDSMKYPMVVHQRGVERLAQGEAAQQLAVERVDAGLPL